MPMKFLFHAASASDPAMPIASSFLTSNISCVFTGITNHKTLKPTDFHPVSPTDPVPAKISPPTHPIMSPPSSAPLTSPPAAYPAVLVGRSNSELKAKVPPPVPPRGTPKVKRVDSNGKGAQCFGNAALSGDASLLHAGPALLVVVGGRPVRPLHVGRAGATPNKNGRRRHRKCYSDETKKIQVAKDPISPLGSDDLLKVEIASNCLRRSLNYEDLYKRSKIDFRLEEFV